MIWLWIVIIIVAMLLVVVIWDVSQKRHAILRNFPIIGHFRYILESVGPELRQYIVTDNDEERPFSRDQRRWIYASAKKQNNYFGFGTDNELELATNYLIINHSAFPEHDPHPGEDSFDPAFRVPCAKVLGGARGRVKAFRPDSIINISGMSYGSLSGPAVVALNRGAKLCDCLHNTGEGGVARHHQHGGDLMWQVGTGYFGCRDSVGQFSMDMLLDVVDANPVRAIEIKLSQGAKPGLGGVLPAAKVTHEISQIRLIQYGKDCISPSSHAEFSDVDSLLDFVERIADRTGVPVGIKSAVGQMAFWHELAAQMQSGDRGVDFITIDGGEGGTGAAPLVFADHVALPFKVGFSRVYSIFAEAGLTDRIVFNGSGKLGFPDTALLAFAMGCDLVAVGREAMMAIGCIQAQRCHTGHCPTGVATQNRWLMRGLDPTSKSARLANYVTTLRKEVMTLSRSCGVTHPALITLEHFDILDGRFGASSPHELFHYRPEWGRPSALDVAEVERIMHGRAHVAREEGVAE